MRMDKLTSKLQQALADAQSLAVGKDHNYLEPVHVLTALVDQKGGSLRPLLMQTGFNMAELRAGLDKLLNDLPVVAASDGQMNVSPDFTKLFNIADRIAQNQAPGRFKLVSGGQALLAESHSLARAPWLVAIELDGQASGARIFHASAIDLATLEACFPTLASWRENIYWDAEQGRLTGERIRALGPLVAQRRPLDQLPPQAVRDALIDALREGGQLPWSDEDRQLLGRLALLHHTLGEPWPAVDDASLLAGLEQWLGPHLTGISRLDQIARLPLGQYLLDGLLDTVDWTLRRELDTLAPTHLTVPSGSRIRLDYSGDEPVLAVKLQELFGQTDTPRLVGGRVPVLIHLLSPARRPVQVTRDLASLCTRLDLAASWGSDFHRPGQPWAELGRYSTPPLGVRPVWDSW